MNYASSLPLETLVNSSPKLLATNFISLVVSNFTEQLFSSTTTTTTTTSTASIGQSSTEGHGFLCRARRQWNATEDDYLMSPDVFTPISCIQCANYLKLPFSYDHWPIPDQPETLERACTDLNFSEMDCDRWKQCCNKAAQCCSSQIANQIAKVKSAIRQCPQVWDGYSCIPSTRPNQAATVICPNYLYEDSDPGPFELYATRQCDSHGEWEMYESKKGEYTDYVQCVTGRQQWDQDLNNFKIICECISIVTLATSIFCFLYCRQLRSQAAYRVHTQMFLAMLLYTISCLLRETIVHHYVVSNDYPPGCATITMLVRLFMITAYSAMSVEAFYLHWNVAMALKPLNDLKLLIGVGWSLPVVIAVFLYIPLRYSYGGDEYNSYCWIQPWENYEFIIYGPNFACLTMNIGFLISLFVITCRLKNVSVLINRRTGRRSSSHPCEILKRREFRAMITFTFLFGVPQALVLIRPTGLTGIWFKIYEMTSVALQMLQGAFASILLCYLNTEVRTIFFRTALGLKIDTEKKRYESMISNVSVRVRNSARFSFMVRSKNSATRSSGDSAMSMDGMTPSVRSPAGSTSTRPVSAMKYSKRNGSGGATRFKHNSLGLSSTGGGAASGNVTPSRDGSLASLSAIQRQRHDTENSGYVFVNGRPRVDQTPSNEVFETPSAETQEASKLVRDESVIIVSVEEEEPMIFQNESVVAEGQTNGDNNNA